jgi:hypothetical protein
MEYASRESHAASKPSRLPLKPLKQVNDFEKKSEFDVIVVGAGHFVAGTVLALRHLAPEQSILVVDSSSGPGGAWRTANSYSQWVAPVPVPTMVRQFYLTKITGLPTPQSRFEDGFMSRDGVIAMITDIFKWSQADMAFGFQYEGFNNEQGGHQLRKIQGNKKYTIQAKRVIWPRYRNMNSFDDISTRLDQPLRLDLPSIKGVRILGNSLQAGEMVNFLQKSNQTSLKIEIYYRKPYMLLDGPALFAMLNTILVPVINGVPVDQSAVRQIFIDLIARSSKPVQDYVHKWFDKQDDIFWYLKYLPLHYLNASNGARMSFIDMTELPSTVDVNSVPPGWVVVDARTNVAEPMDNVPPHPDVHRPSLSIRGIYVPEDNWLVPTRSMPIISPITIGYSFVAYGLANDWKFNFDPATKDVLDHSYWAWPVVAKKYLPSEILNEVPPNMCELCSIAKYFFLRRAFAK